MSSPPEIELDLQEEIGATVGYIEAYAERRIQLAKLDIAEVTAKTGAKMATALVLMSLLPIMMTVLSIGLGFLISDSLEWPYAAGFLLLAGVYLLIGIVLFLFRKTLFTEPILTKLIQELFRKKID